MRVLLIAWSFPPDWPVGGIRAAKVAEAFLDSGHQVDVITSRLAQGELQRPTARGLRVHPVVSIPNPTEAYGRFKRIFDSRGIHADETPGGQPAPSSEVESPRPAWRRTLLSILHLPDKWNGFVIPALWTALRLVRDMDLVYTTAPPFSDHLVGLALKKIVGIRWVAEFRDPWTENPASSTDSRSRIGDRLNLCLERHCLDAADQIVAVTDGIHDLLAEHSTLPSAERIVTVRNGIDTLNVKTKVARPSTPLSILYIGSIYARRDPRPFLLALADLRRAHGFGPQEVSVCFVGKCENVDGTSLDAIGRELGISDLLKIRGWVPHAEAMDLVSEAGILLLLATHQPLQVPNKLYEYLGTGKPILAFADEDGEVARMLRRVGGHHVITVNDRGVVRQTLERALGLSGTDPREEVDRAILREWTTASQMEHLRKSLGV